MGVQSLNAQKHQSTQKLKQPVEQEPTGNMEVFTSGLEPPSRPSTPTFGPDNPLALVSPLRGQTGLWYRSQVVYEDGVKGN